MSSNGIGELGEIEFIRAALRRNLQVSKPILHDSKYDCIVDNKKNLLKIQIKTTSKPISRTTKFGDAFHITTAHGSTQKNVYSKKDVDFFAIYLMPIDVWYIIPIKETGGNIRIKLLPYSPVSKWNVFKDAWNLLV